MSSDQQGLPVELVAELLTQILAKVTKLTIWLTFAVAHLTVAVLVMALLWWFQVSPQAIQTWVAQGFRPGSTGPTILGIAAFLGISGGGAIWTYARAWQWMIRRYVRPELVKRG